MHRFKVKALMNFADASKAMRANKQLFLEPECALSQ